MINKKDMLNLESAMYLTAIAQNSGKRKAAISLNTSVDTINKYIDNLEKELGAKLLSSNGRGSTLTAQGEKVFENAMQIKGLLKDIYNICPASDEVRGEVRVAVSLFIRACLLPRDIRLFFDKYPELSVVSILKDDEPDMSDMSYEIGLTCKKPDDNADVVIYYIKKVQCGFFASPGYLSQYGYPVDMDDMLKNYRLVSKTGNATFIKGWKDILKKSHCSYETNGMFAVREMIDFGVGIGVLPMRFKDEGLVCLDNIKSESDLTFYLLARKGSKDLPRVRTVLDYYKELLSRF